MADVPENKPLAEASTAGVTPKRKPAPTLYAIIAFKLLKGAGFLTIALILYALSDNDLPYEYQRALDFLRFNPERKFWSDLADKVGDITQREVIRVSIGTFLYSLFSLVEGTGMIFRVKWAVWLTIAESAFFIPLEVHELMHHYSHLVFVILVFNIIIVWYLYQNRERLFRHPH